MGNSTSYKSWTISHANLTLDSSTTSDYQTVENQTLCLSSSYEYLVDTTDQTISNQLLDYFGQICDSGDRTNCPEKNADKAKVKKVKLGFSDRDLNANDDNKLSSYNITLNTDDILWFDNRDDGNVLKPLVGQYVSTADAQSKYGCYGATFIVGRPFLSKNEAVFRVEKDQISMAFISNEGTSSIFLIILIILG